MSGKSRLAAPLLTILVTVSVGCALPSPTPTLTAAPEPTLEASFTPVVSATPTPTPTLERTPEPTPTPKPTTTPEPTPDTDEDISYSRRTPFVPLDNPALLTAEQATYLSDEEFIMGLEWAGQARAYPIQMLRYHHIVNDTVAGQPILITF